MKTLLVVALILSVLSAQHSSAAMTGKVANNIFSQATMPIPPPSGGFPMYDGPYSTTMLRTHVWPLSQGGPSREYLSIYEELSVDYKTNVTIPFLLNATTGEQGSISVGRAQLMVYNIAPGFPFFVSGAMISRIRALIVSDLDLKQSYEFYYVYSSDTGAMRCLSLAQFPLETDLGTLIPNFPPVRNFAEHQATYTKVSASGTTTTTTQIYEEVRSSNAPAPANAPYPRAFFPFRINVTSGYVPGYGAMGFLLDQGNHFAVTINPDWFDVSTSTLCLFHPPAAVEAAHRQLGEDLEGKRTLQGFAYHAAFGAEMGYDAATFARLASAQTAGL